MPQNQIPQNSSDTPDVIPDSQFQPDDGSASSPESSPEQPTQAQNPDVIPDNQFQPDDFSDSSGSVDEGNQTSASNLPSGQQNIADIGAAGIYGLNEGLTLGADEGLINTAQMQQLKAEHPWAFTAGRLIGNTTLGAAATAALPEIAGVTAAAKIGAFALDSAIQGGLWGATDEVSKIAQGKTDPNQPVSQMLYHAGAHTLFDAGLGALTGSALGAAGVGTGAGIKSALATDVGKKMTTWLSDLGAQWKWLQNNQHLDVESLLPHQDVSPSAAGQELKSSLTNKIQQEAAPFDQMYGAIKQVTPDIPVLPEDKTAAIQDIQDMIKSPSVGKSSPGAKMANDILSDLPDYNNVDQLRDFRQGLNARANNAVPQEKMVISNISQRLQQLENDSINGSAERIQSTLNPNDPEQAAHLANIQNLQTQIQNASQQYAPFRQKLNDLASWLGKSRISGPQDAVQFVQNLEPEDVLQRLGNKKYAGLSQFMEQNFPEESQILKNYQKSQMLQNASTSGDFDQAKFFGQYNRLSPEMQNSLFQPQEQQVIQNANQYFNASKGKFFSIKSAGARAADKLWHIGVPAFSNRTAGSLLGAEEGYRHYGLAGGVAGVAIGNMLLPSIEEGLQRGITHAAVPLVLKTLSADQPYAIAAALEHSNAVTRGGAAMAADVNSLFTRTPIQPKAVDQRKADKTDSYVKSRGLDNELQKAAQATTPGAAVVNPPTQYAKGGMVDPSLPKEGHSLSNAIPEQGMLANSAKARVYNYLSSALPQEDMTLPFDNQKPHPEKHKNYKKALNVAVNPSSIMKSIQDGTLTTQELTHFKSMWPEIHQELSNRITTRMMKAKANKEPMPPYKTRQAISMFMGQTMESSLSPQAIIAAQSVFAPKSSPQAPGPSSKKTKTSAKVTQTIEKTNNMYKTPSQAATQDSSQRGSD